MRDQKKAAPSTTRGRQSNFIAVEYPSPGAGGQVRLNANHVREAARGKWLDIFTKLEVDSSALNGKHHPCPACGGTDRFRYDDEDGRGTYYCSGCGAGDGFSLVGKLLGLTADTDFPALLERVAGVLGITAGSPLLPVRQAAPTPRQRTSQGNQTVALKTWDESQPDPGPVAVSIASRGITIPIPPDLRWHSGQGMMVALVRAADGSPQAIHRTYLSRQGDDRKKMLGPIAGGAVRLGEVEDDGRLALAEGIETALSVQQATGIPTWAALSAGGLERVILPESVREVLIFADSDTNGVGQQAAHKAAARFRAEGREASIIFPCPQGATPEKLDFNDLLQASHSGESIRARLAEPETAPPPVEELAADPAPKFQKKARRSTGSGEGVIQLEGGEISSIVQRAEEMLLEAGGLYQYGGGLVRLVASPKAETSLGVTRPAGVVTIKPIDLAWLVLRLSEVASWERFDGRTKSWLSTDCPDRVARAFLADAGRWPFPELAGVIAAPTLRADGSILAQPGYDQRTGLFLADHGLTIGRELTSPTRDDALTALARLKDLVETFPFVSESDRAVALSGILTAVIRRSLPTAPMHAFSAPTAGSGKSKLVDMAAIIVTGHPAAVMGQGRSEEELEKRLGAVLLAGDSLLNIDNVSQPLGGDLLCQCMTQGYVRLRPLGGSHLATVPASAAMFSTGNNLVLAGDMTRRAVLCRLDPGVERPELRQFKSDPVANALNHRGKYLTDALTILRAHHLAGRPGCGLVPLGSFEAWSGWVRAALVWLGEADPCSTMEEVRAADPELSSLQAVLAAWTGCLGQRRVSVKEIIGEFALPGRGTQAETLREALLTVAGDGGFVNSRRLGKWLSKYRNRIAGGFVVRQMPMIDGAVTWRVESSEVGFSGLSGFLSPLRDKLSNEIGYHIGTHDSYIRVGQPNPLNHTKPTSSLEVEEVL